MYLQKNSGCQEDCQTAQDRCRQTYLEIERLSFDAFHYFQDQQEQKHSPWEKNKEWKIHSAIQGSEIFQVCKKVE